MARIPQQFIDELLARADIVEIINARVPLKRAGHEFRACCPFHNEKTPSFYVSPQKQFYHCFGCGAHGTALGFLIEHDRLDFIEATETIADSLGLQVPYEGNSNESGRNDTRDTIYHCLEDAAGWFRQRLRDHPTAIDYLKQRGLNGETANRFGLGYAPGGWDRLLKELRTKYPVNLLVEAGLVLARDQRHYDRFRDRIMFPIRDPRGRVIGFGGRILDEGSPKYLNSSESPVFHKGQSLYGLYEARQSNTDLNEIVIVEGYMDVISLAQQGVHNAVATLGTATTHEHVRRLYRMAKRVIFCFDGDRAGRSAAWRALEQTLPVIDDGHEAAFLFLPEDQDPDSFIRSQGRMAFLEACDQATSLSQLLIQELRKRHPGHSMEARAGLASEGMSLLDKLRAKILRAQLVETLAREVGLDSVRLENGKARQVDPPGKEQQTNRSTTVDRRQTIQWSPLRTTIALLVEFPALMSDAPAATDLGIPDNPGIVLYADLLETLKDYPNITTAGILERWRGRTDEPYLMRLLESREIHLEFDDARREFKDAVARLLAQRSEIRFETLIHKLQGEGLSREEKAEFGKLAAQLGRVTTNSG